MPMAVVTPDIFPLLGVAPIAGRVLAPADDAHGAERTAVISETLWDAIVRRAIASIIGKPVLLDGDPIVDRRRHAGAVRVSVRRREPAADLDAGAAPRASRRSGPTSAARRS